MQKNPKDRMPASEAVHYPCPYPLRLPLTVSVPVPVPVPVPVRLTLTRDTHQVHHPWIKQQSTLHSGEDAAHEMQRHQDIVDSLQAFSEADDLKRVALEVIAFSTPPGKLDPEAEP